MAVNKLLEHLGINNLKPYRILKSLNQYKNM